MRFVIILALLVLAQPGYADDTSCRRIVDERFSLQFQADSGMQGDIADLQQQINGLTGALRVLQARLSTTVIRENIRTPKARLGGGHHQRKHSRTRARN